MTGIINGKIATLLAAMHMLIFTLLATCSITGFFAINWKRLFNTGIITVLLITVIVIGTRAFLSHSLTDAYNKDKVIAGMQLLRNPLPAIIHKTVPLDPVIFDSKQPRLERIRKDGILRVGYNAARMPFTFFNAKGDLVGFDIEMANELAGDLGVNLEFIPFQIDTMEQQLKLDHFDIIMSGIPMITFFLEEMSFSRSYLDTTMALVVKDYRRGEFNRFDDIKNISDLKIGIVSTQTYAAKAKELLPRAQVVALNSHYQFFEGAGGDLDALLVSAEMGSAWTLLYPDYQVVVPKPNIHKIPMSYPIAGNDQAMINFMNHWVELKKKDKTIDRLYNYWILGKGAKPQKPRWSIIRNVLHWVD
jgi:ABC-type amino acid transport substrate-binding protein